MPSCWPCIDAVALVIYAIVAFRRERGYATWAVRAEPEARRGVPAIALITPLVPLVLYYVLKIEAAPAFLISALYGVLTTRPSVAVQRLVSSAIRGVEDVAAAIVLFMGIGMLLVATQQPQFAAALQPIVGGRMAAQPARLRAALRRGESARAIPRSAQSLRRRHRRSSRRCSRRTCFRRSCWSRRSWRWCRCRTSATPPTRRTCGSPTSPASQSTRSPNERCRSRWVWRSPRRW